MGTNPQIKALISLAYQYSARNSDKNLTTLQRQLQILSVVSDLSIFEPVGVETFEFYVCLEQLLTEVDVKSPLAWKVIDLLSHICQSSSIRMAIRDKIQLLPILTKIILSPKISNDKFSKVLHLLESISYGIQITRREGWMMRLIPNLVETIIHSSDQTDLMETAMVTLANLCRGNPPSVKVLQDFSERKALMRCLAGIRSASARAQLLVAEMMIYANIDYSKLEKNQVNHLLDLIFSVAVSSVANEDLQLTVLAKDIFREFLRKQDLHEALKSYGQYPDQVHRLLDCINPSISEDFVNALLEFSAIILTVEAPNHPDFVELVFTKSLSYIHKMNCGSKAAGLLNSLIMYSEDKTIAPHMNELIETLKNCLDVALQENSSEKHVDWLCSVLSVLKLIIEKDPSYFASASIILEASIFPGLQQKLISTYFGDFAPSCSWSSESSWSSAAKDSVGSSGLGRCSEAIVRILSIVKQLAVYKPEFMLQYGQLMNEAALMQHIVVCLGSTDASVVAEAAKVICDANMPSETLQALIKAQSDSNKARAPMKNVDTKPDGAQCSEVRHVVQFAPVYEENVTNLISRLNGSIDKTELRNIPLTDVMELYEYKLAAMAHNEESLQEALNAADQQIRKTQQISMQSRAESDRLRGLLKSWEARLQEVHKEKSLSEEQVSEIQESARQLRQSLVKEKTAVQRQLAQTEAELASEKQVTRKREEELKRYQKAVAESHAECRSLQKLVKEEQERYKKSKEKIHKYEEEAKKSQTSYEDLEKKMEKLNKNNGLLKTKVTELELLMQAHEKSLAEKETELEELMKTNNSLKRIQDMIHNISSGKT